MNEESKTKSNSIIPILIIVVAVIAVTSISKLRNQSVAEYVNDSGEIVASKSNSYSQWFGQDAPDFTVTDIDGNIHSISDYRGKNLMVVFWATWCQPCKEEIPHLIELRKQESEDNLAILAISSEKADTVKNFAKVMELNYTVAPLGNILLPRPFAEVNAIPTSFFIDPNGKIKTVVVQSLTLKQIKAILNAKSAG